MNNVDVSKIGRLFVLLANTKGLTNNPEYLDCSCRDMCNINAKSIRYVGVNMH